MVILDSFPIPDQNVDLNLELPTNRTGPPQDSNLTTQPSDTQDRPNSQVHYQYGS